jgi:hypothetical protein
LRRLRLTFAKFHILQSGEQRLQILLRRLTAARLLRRRSLLRWLHLAQHLREALQSLLPLTAGLLHLLGELVELLRELFLLREPLHRFTQSLRSFVRGSRLLRSGLFQLVGGLGQVTAFHRLRGCFRRLLLLQRLRQFVQLLRRRLLRGGLHFLDHLLERGKLAERLAGGIAGFIRRRLQLARTSLKLLRDPLEFFTLFLVGGFLRFA